MSFEPRCPMLDISIRYQLSVGQSIIELALKDNIIRPGSRLCIIGAGVAGSAAAMEAASARVLTDLTGTPFSVQSLCHTRILHPFQYIWPETGWDETKQNNPPLTWKKGVAADIAVDWKDQLDSFVAESTYLKLVRDLPRALDKPVETFRDFLSVYPQLADRSYYDMILLATGWRENCAIQKESASFRGWAFWETDKVESENSNAPAILVSGAGDGALQDCLRLCFKGIPAELIAALDAALVAAGAKSLTEQLRSTASQERTLFEGFLDKALAGRAASCVKVEQLWNEKIDALLHHHRRQIESVFHRFSRFPFSSGKLRLLTKDSYVTRCYPLNRLLVGLLLKLAALNDWDLKLWKETEVKKITPIGHVCVDPDSCWGREHHVEFTTKSPEISQYILVRHGVQLRMLGRESASDPAIASTSP